MTLPQRNTSAIDPHRSESSRPQPAQELARKQAFGPDLQLLAKDLHWPPLEAAGTGARSITPHHPDAPASAWGDESSRRANEGPVDLIDDLSNTGSALRRARKLADTVSRTNQARLGAARQARAAAEVGAVERAIALAATESRRLAETEAALSAAAAATRQARADLERLRRHEVECRQRADAQRAVTVQARMIERTLKQRHGINAVVSGSSSGSDSPTGSDVGASARPDAADASGFAPTVVQAMEAAPAPIEPTTPAPAPAAPAPQPRPTAPGLKVPPEALPILSVVPSDRSFRSEAANRPRMGTVLIEGKRLTPVDVEVVLMHQAGKPRRFGEIAVSLGLLEVADVVWALRRQRPHPQGDAGGVVTPIAEPLVIRDRPDSPAAAVIRDIARQIVERGAANATRQALSIVSVGIGEGKSTVAANLAMAMAEQGRRVLLLDTDFTRSRLKLMLPGLSASKGLSAVLAGREHLSHAIARPVGWSPQPRDLHVLPAGDNSGEPARLARLPAFMQLLQKLLGHYDQVLLDTPATSQGPGAMELACLAGPALVVARPGHTRSTDLDHLTRSLREGGAQVLGVVMNSH